MRKKTIAIFFIIGIVVAIIGIALMVVGGASAVNDVNSAAAGTTPTVSSGAAGLLVIGYAVLVIALLINTIGWIGALVATGKQGRWGWFVCIFLFTPISELIYLIAGPGL